MYELVFYEDAQGNCPIEELISKLDEKAAKNKNARIQLKQIMFQFDLIGRTGTRCSSEYVKHIRDDIWELRPGDNRILFFGWNGNKFVLLHAFRKKTQETPPKEIEKAEKELRDWVNRYGR